MPRKVEEATLFAVDCVVVCCCCPCLVLQLTVFLFIRLPHKLAVKSKKIVLRKMHKRSKGRDGVVAEEVEVKREDRMVEASSSSSSSSSSSPFEGEMMSWFGEERRAWVEAQEKVWEELVVEEGLFWFGSFWANGD